MKGLVVKRLGVLALVTATIAAIFSSLPTVSADPITLNVVGTTDTTVDLEWDKTVLAEAEFGWYLIERHTKDFEMFYARITDINATRWTDQDLHPSTGYGYKIYVCYGRSVWPSCIVFEESGFVSATTQNSTLYATKWELQVARSELLHAIWSLQQLQSILRSDAVNETDELWDAIYRLNETVSSLNQNITELRWDILNLTSELRSDTAERFATVNDGTRALQHNISFLRADAAEKTGDQGKRLSEVEMWTSSLGSDMQLSMVLLLIVLIIAIIGISLGAVGVVRAGRVSRELKELPPPVLEVPQTYEVEQVPEEPVSPPIVTEEVPEERPPEPVEEIQPPAEEKELPEEREPREPEAGEEGQPEEVGEEEVSEKERTE